MRTIAIVNHKGGCGKTVTAINLSACLADGKKRVLLIDLDPQGHASLGFDIKPEETERNMYHVLSETHWEVGLADVIVMVDKYLHLAPSGIILSAVEQELAGQPGREDRLLNALAVLSEQYDFVVVDCPPSLGLLTFNALRACREVLVPIETSFFALHGLGKISETIKLVEDRYGQRKQILALATIYDRRTRIAKEVLEELGNHFGEDLLKTIIHINVRLKEATGFGQPISQYDRRSSGYRDYADLAREITARGKSRSDRLQPTTARALPLGTQLLKDGIRFTIDVPGAKQVQIAGDFNDWDPSKGAMLDMDGQGIWSKILPLKPGRYQYRYVVDGQWQEDPNNPKRVVSPLGVNNSLIEYEEQEETQSSER